ncbi:hypothetical protein KMI6_9 [Klebsiella phage KMI6]|uniref:Uncharacterized protein n=1 Tax=Klebsiella phage KMI6 TaxID=2601617 RepID=A0A5B9N7Q2_9CAUD|nr:hypothetical protein KMI6_9 [Klebsiella phage KMI6]
MSKCRGPRARPVRGRCDGVHLQPLVHFYYALGLSLVLPYGYPCAWHCVAPVRPTWRRGYPCALSVGHRGVLCLAYFAEP